MNVLGETITEKFALYHGDTIEVSKALPDASVDFSVFSPPFASLYTYSNSPRDLGNVRNDEEFFEHYDYLVREQARVMKPGRIVAIHCMLMPTSKTRDGHIGLRDFRGDLIRAYEKRGFIFHSEVCIWKCPVNAVTRTKALGLLYKQLRKDSSMSRQGIADYLVIMRTPHRERSGGHESYCRLDPKHTGPCIDPVDSKDENNFPVERWQRYASPVWATSGEADDEGFLRLSDQETANESSGINPSNTLQYKSAREHDDERHVCPLQLEVIRRSVRLWSNPDDLVWSPFTGIGSEGYVALQEGRRFVGAELKESYYRQAAINLAEAQAVKQGTLFGAVGT